MSNFIKIPPVGAKLFHADRHDEADSCFTLFCERVSKSSVMQTKNQPSPSSFKLIPFAFHKVSTLSDNSPLKALPVTVGSCGVHRHSTLP